MRKEPKTKLLDSGTTTEELSAADSSRQGRLHSPHEPVNASLEARSLAERVALDTEAPPVDEDEPTRHYLPSRPAEISAHLWNRYLRAHERAFPGEPVARPAFPPAALGAHDLVPESLLAKHSASSSDSSATASVTTESAAVATASPASQTPKHDESPRSQIWQKLAARVAQAPRRRKLRRRDLP